MEDYIRNIPDFPKKGVEFKDITPLLLNPEAREICLNLFLSYLKGHSVDKVVSIESRRFFFGILLAHKLEAGFIPIRKKGKLPFETLEETYNLEYGTGILEIHRDAINKGDKVLIHDDVLATGGTALSACRLVERMGGEIVQVNFLLEIENLRGAEKLLDYPVLSLMKF